MNNVVLISADSLRADHCGWLGGKDLTPNLDRIAKDSLCFKDAIAPGPRTPSSIPISFTGKDLPVSSHNTNNYDERVSRIRAHMGRNQTISEKFKDRGYETVGFTANPWTSAENKFDSGFDVFREVGKDGGSLRDIFSNTPIQKPARFLDLWINKDTWFSQWRTFYSELITSIEEASEPYFVWIFLLDAHNPYIVPRKDRQESSTFSMYSSVLRANSLYDQSKGDTAFSQLQNDATINNIKKSYRDCVRSVDKFVGQLESDISDETSLIFHSDHGEAFGEHGTIGHEPVLYSENIQVPLLVSNCNCAADVEFPISTKRIPEIALSTTKGEQIDPDVWNDEFVFSRNETGTGIAVRNGEWKFIQYESGDELYDLSVDPEEKENLAKSYQKKVKWYRKVIDKHIGELPNAKKESGSSGSKEMREHLRDLGYL